MGNESATPTPQRRGRLKRWLRWGLIALVTLILLLAIAGAAYQAIENRADARRFPEQGKAISLGPSFANTTLNLDCQGQGSPSVILDSGLGVPAVGWKHVQVEVAKFTRVCSYDRAGYGWSSVGAFSRTSSEIVKELHALLEAAGEKGPHVLVGHSFGGYNVRVYNGQYPGEVAGMVLVDASQEDQVSRMPAALQEFMKKEEEGLKRQKLLAPLLIRIGFARFSQRGETQGPGITKEFGDEMLYLQLQTKFIDAAISEMESFSESANEVRAAGNLGDKPLIVLTAGKETAETDLPKGIPKKDMEEFHDIWMKELQVKEAHLSTRGKQIIVPDSDHMIPFERPDAIVAAIREVCAAANTGKSGAQAPSGPR